MKKIVLLCSVVIMLAAVLAGCGTNAADQSADGYALIINGKAIAFPTTYRDLLEKGLAPKDTRDFTAEELENLMIPGSNFRIYQFHSDKTDAGSRDNVNVYFENLSETEKPVAECDVIGVSYAAFSDTPADVVSIQGPNGQITVKTSTRAEILQFFDLTESDLTEGEDVFSSDDNDTFGVLLEGCRITVMFNGDGEFYGVVFHQEGHPVWKFLDE